MTITVALADDQPLVRMGLRVLLEPRTTWSWSARPATDTRSSNWSDSGIPMSS